MDKRAVGRNVALVTGLGVVAVVALGVVYWKEFWAQYYIFRLNREPGYFHEVIVLPKSCPLPSLGSFPSPRCRALSALSMTAGSPRHRPV